MANNYIPGFTPSLHGRPVKRMAIGGRMESGRWFNERDDLGDTQNTLSNIDANSVPANYNNIVAPTAADTYQPTAAQPTAAAPVDYSNYDFGNFDLGAFSQPYSSPAASYSFPTPQPVQTAPYTPDTSAYSPFDYDQYNIGNYGAQSYAAPSYQSQPTPQPVQTAPYYGDYSYDPYNIGNFDLSPYNTPEMSSASGLFPGTTSADFSGILNKVLAKADGQGLTQSDQQPTAASAVGMPPASFTSGFFPGTTSSDFSGALNKVMTQADQQGLTQQNPQMGALPATPPSATPAAISANAPPPGTTWGVYSDPNDTTSQYTVNFSGGKKGSMPLTVSKDTPVFLYDNKTKQVLASGIGPEGANAVAAAVYKMNTDPNSKNEWWDIYTGPPGATDPSQFTSVVTDPRNTNFGQRFLSNLGTILPFAIQLIPGLGQASLLTKVAAGAAAGAGGAALKGQDIFKGALIGGATSGVLGANVLPGGQNLSGVLGKTLEGVPVVGDALKGVSGAIKGGGSSFNPATGTITTTATKSLTPSLISGGLTSVVGSSALNKALDLAQRYPGATNYADQVYGKEPTLEQQFDETMGAPTTVYGNRVSDLAPAVTGATGALSGSIQSGYDPVQNEITAVGDKGTTKLDEPASGVVQMVAPELVDPNEIVVSNKYKPQTLDQLANGLIGSLAPSLLNSGTTQPTTTTDSKKSTLDKIVDYLRLAGLASTAIGGLTGGKGSSSGLSGLSGARGPLNPIFSAQLPTANMQSATPRSMAGTDWYRYGYGPEQSFFSHVPQGGMNTSTAYTGYETSPRYNAGQQYVADLAALLNSPQTAAVAQPTTSQTTATQPAATQAAASLPVDTARLPSGAPSDVAASQSSTATSIPHTPGTPIPGLSKAQQLYYDRIATGPTIDKAQYDYVKGLSDYQALASLSNYDSLLGSAIYNGPNGFRTMDELEAYYNTPLYTYGGDILRKSNLPGYAEGGEVTDDEYRLAQQLIAAEQNYGGEKQRAKRKPSFRSQHDYDDKLYSRYELEFPVGDEGALQLNAMGRGFSPDVMELAARLGNLRASHMLGGGSEYGYSTPVAGGNLDISAYAPRGLAPSGIRASYRKQFDEGGYAVGGPGDGRDDKIPAMLSDGEYVIDAETVAMLGNGSNKAGAEALDKLRVNVRKHKGRQLSKGKFSVNAKKPEQYLKGRK